jgi:hypothetical protein
MLMISLTGSPGAAADGGRIIESGDELIALEDVSEQQLQQLNHRNIIDRETRHAQRPDLTHRPTRNGEVTPRWPTTSTLSGNLRLGRDVVGGCARPATYEFDVRMHSTGIPAPSSSVLGV